MEAHQKREGSGGDRHPFRHIRPPEKPGADRAGRGAGGHLQVGERAQVPRPGRGQVPLRPERRPAGAGLRHPVGGEHVPRPAGGLPPVHPVPPLQPARPSGGAHRGHEGGAARRQRHLPQRPPPAGLVGGHGGGGAEHSASQPAGGQPHGHLRRVRRGAHLPPVLGAPDLPLGQRTAHVPLLRPLGAAASRLPLLRGSAELYRRGHPEGGGGAEHGLPGAGDPADGHRHHLRHPEPREAAGPL